MTCGIHLDCCLEAPLRTGVVSLPLAQDCEVLPRLVISKVYGGRGLEAPLRSIDVPASILHGAELEVWRRSASRGQAVHGHEARLRVGKAASLLPYDCEVVGRIDAPGV